MYVVNGKWINTRKLQKSEKTEQVLPFTRVDDHHELKSIEYCFLCCFTVFSLSQVLETDSGSSEVLGWQLMDP